METVAFSCSIHESDTYQTELEEALSETFKHVSVRYDTDNSYLAVEFEHWTGVIDEFPGNCSTLVVSGIQGVVKSSDDRKFNVVFDFIERIPAFLSYGQLMLSIAHVAEEELPVMVLQRLQGRGYELISSGVYNPHSGNKNYFFAKRFVYPHEEEG